MSAGLASSAGVVYVPRPRRDGRLMLAAESAAMGGAAAGDEGPAPTAVVPVVVAAARLMQHPTLLVHPIAAAGGGSTGPGRYLAHAPLVAATVLQGAGGLRGGGFEHGFALHLPLLLVTEAAAVLFAGGGLDAVLVLPLAATGGRAAAGVRRRAKMLSDCCVGIRIWLLQPSGWVHSPAVTMHTSLMLLQRRRCATQARKSGCSPQWRHPRASLMRQVPRRCCAS